METNKLSTFDSYGHETLQAIAQADLFNKWMYETIYPFINGNILELGSGIGNITDLLLKDFSSVSISDYNPDYTSFLKNKYSKHHRIKSILSIDLQDSNFKHKHQLIKESFDTIILLNVIEHLPNDILAIDLCNYLLKKGGNLILLAPAYKLLYSRIDSSLGHYRRYTVKSLSQLFNNDSFKVIETSYFNFLGAIGWFFLNKLTGSKNINKKEMIYFNKLVPIAKVLDMVILNKVGLSVIVISRKESKL